MLLKHPFTWAWSIYSGEDFFLSIPDVIVYTCNCICIIAAVTTFLTANALAEKDLIHFHYIFFTNWKFLSK